jgi:hypothetical protein
VRDDDARHLVACEFALGRMRQREPRRLVHVLAVELRDLRAFDRFSGERRHGRQQLRDAESAGPVGDVVGGVRRRTGDRAASAEHDDRLQRAWHRRRFWI